VSPQAKVYLDMFMPLKGMVEGMNQGKHIAVLDAITEVTKQLSILYSLFFTEYDGGEFCRGLIFSKELATVMLTFGRNIFSGFFGEHTGDV